MMPIRRCPSASRCRVAASPPFQLVAPMEAVSWTGSPVGSTTTNGIPRALSWACIPSHRSENTATAPPAGARGCPRSSRARSPRPCIPDRRPRGGAGPATCSTPGTISSAHSDSSSWKMTSSSGADVGCPPAADSPAPRSISSTRRRVSGETSGRPLITLDTVGTETPARRDSSAIVAAGRGGGRRGPRWQPWRGVYAESFGRCGFDTGCDSGLTGPRNGDLHSARAETGGTWIETFVHDERSTGTTPGVVEEVESCQCVAYGRCRRQLSRSSRPPVRRRSHTPTPAPSGAVHGALRPRTAAPSTAAESPSAAAGEPVTIDWWHIPNGDPGKADLAGDRRRLHRRAPEREDQHHRPRERGVQDEAADHRSRPATSPTCSSRGAAAAWPSRPTPAWSRTSPPTSRPGRTPSTRAR